MAIAGKGGQVFDVSCFGVDAAGKLSDDRYFVFYNQKESPERAITADGSSGGELEVFSVDLARLPSTIQKLMFTATIDGAGTMRDVSSGALRLAAGGRDVAGFSFSGSDFAEEKAIIIGEVYLKDLWRFAAVGQGFNGGLSALLAHLGGEEVAPSAAPAASPPVNLRKVELEKKMETAAPALLSLAKKAQVSLEKKQMGNHVARVALCLDISASMVGLYRSGKVQRFAEKILALGTRFDDDGEIDVFLFGARAHNAGSMGVDNFAGISERLLKEYGYEGGTEYGKALEAIRKHYFPDGHGGERAAPRRDKLPVYVMFLTDGQTTDKKKTIDQIRWASYEPIFWQFMGIGASKWDRTPSLKKRGDGRRGPEGEFAFLEQLDNLDGRYVDNANFFSVEDPEAVGDEELYDLLMEEYPEWVKLASAKGLLG